MSVRCSTASSATCRRRGRSTACIRRWRGRRTTARSCSGPAERSGASTSRAARRAVIPFHVTATRKDGRGACASRWTSRRRASRCRMLRWVEVSPRGDQVVYQALGHIWVRDLPSGTPRRLTSQTDHFELYPSFSRDGKWIVFTTWDDEKAGLGARRAGARRGRGAGADAGARALPRAGLLARRHEGRLPQRHGRRPRDARDWSLEPGIYWVPAAGGGKPTLVTRDGVAPQFGAASDRVYFTRYDGGDDKEEAKRTFASVGARRRGDPRAPAERRRDGVPDLARREVDRLPRALQRVHRAVRPHGLTRRHRSEVEGAPGRARLEGRRRVPALVRRLEEPPLVARAAALHARR